MENLTRKLFYPIFLGMAFAIVLAFDWLLSDRLPLKIITTVGVFIMVGVTIYFERKQPYQKSWNKSKGDVVPDFVLTMIIFPVVIQLCRTLVDLYPASWKLASIASLPLWFQVSVGVLAAEFLFYWIHRLCHENKRLWRIHVWHHSVKRVYWMNSGTLNPVDMVFNFVGYCLPFAVLAMDPRALEYALYFTAITGLLEHANVDFKAGKLNYFFNTAELHRWHHSVVVKESQKNYGKALSIWDLVFGTFYYPPRRQVKKVGLG